MNLQMDPLTTCPYQMGWENSIEPYPNWTLSCIHNPDCQVAKSSNSIHAGPQGNGLEPLLTLSPSASGSSTWSRPPSGSPNSLDYNLSLHLQVTWSQPPTASLYSPDQRHQVLLRMCLSTVCCWQRFQIRGAVPGLCWNRTGTNLPGFTPSKNRTTPNPRFFWPVPQFCQLWTN